MGRAFEFRKARKLKRWGNMARTFTRIGKQIAIAVKAGGPDPDNNSALRAIIATARHENMPKDNIERIAYECERKLLKAVELFDVYEGKNLEPGKKSYAISFILQDEEKTLNDKQIDKIMSKLIASYEKQLGAKLR